jgi:plasmid stability protein
VHRALRIQAAQHGHSVEAEALEILATAVKPEKLEIQATNVEPEKRVLMGDAMAAIGREMALTEEEFAIFENAIARAPTKQLRFND